MRHIYLTKIAKKAGIANAIPAFLLFFILFVALEHTHELIARDRLLAQQDLGSSVHLRLMGFDDADSLVVSCEQVKLLAPPRYL